MMQQKKSSSIWTLCVLALFWHLPAMAQQYSMQAAIGKVPVTGFYAINITPALSACIQADLCDLRIKDTASPFFTPYIIRKGPALNYSTRFTEFPVISSKVDSIYTVVDIESPAVTGVAAITLLIGNTAVERYTSVSGSNDLNKWYIIDEHILFHRSYDNSSGTYAQTIHFPLSTYRYFRLRINNANTDPLNIIKAGQYDRVDTAMPHKYVENAAPNITRNDSSNGISYILVKSAAPYIVNRMMLDIAGPKFYKRDANVSVRTNDSTGRFYTIGSFSLTSGMPAVFDMPAIKTDAIAIEIYNKDNPPLHINGAATYLEAQQMVVWLEAGKTYKLLAGSEEATAPDYDLSHFRDSIPADIPVLSHGPLLHADTMAVVKTAADNNKWLWPVITGAVLILGLLTWRLMADAKGNKTN